MGRTGTTRRHALRAAGAATVTAAGLLAGCTPDSADGRVSSGTKAARAENALRLRSADTSRELLGRYDAVLETFPDASGALAPLRAAVARQVDALAPARKPGSPAPSARPSSSASAAPSSSATVRPPMLPAVSGDAEQALKDLAAAERRTSDAHTATLMDAPPELARLLASLAAASAAHAYLLSELLTKGSAS
ncbi:hypothetical protein [Streptomyces odonnellii]|uniref:hypothetical protein n=1 Tax=Streptomyces odonnellii TaxID=1417980 RepID=UPI000626A121|nr:hypothetical protein [Streptomyces odonnellii]